MRKQSGHEETHRYRERGHLSASANTVILHLKHTLRHMTNYIREREEGGGRHCTESTSTTMDRHTPNTHTHYCTGSQSAFHCTLLAARTSLCLVKKKQQTNRLTNKRTKRRNNAHFGSHWLYNKKINQKRNREYKKSQWHRVLQKAFSQ